MDRTMQLKSDPKNSLAIGKCRSGWSGTIVAKRHPHLATNRAPHSGTKIAPLIGWRRCLPGVAY